MPRLLHFAGQSKGRRVFLATPSYGRLCPPYVHSLFVSQLALLEAGISADYAIMAEHCHVDDSRNELVRCFLETDCDTLVFLDADLGWDAVDLVKLLSHDKDVVAGTYPLKQDSEEFPVRFFPGEIRAQDGLVEVKGVPTGFVAISRRVVQAVYDSEDRHFFARRDDKDKALPIKILFERTYINGERFGGDYWFFERVRKLGFSLWIDPEMDFEHVGEHSWKGVLGAHLRKENGLTIRYGLQRIAGGDADWRVYQEMINAWGNYPWSAGPEFLAACVEVARDGKGPILECGSGLTTLAMAAAAPHRKVYSLEHDERWRHRMTEELNANNLSNVLVVDSPINDGWYSPNWPTYIEFSMLVIDGPPRQLADRFNVFDEVVLKFSSGCVVVADDAQEPAKFQVAGKRLGTEFHILNKGTLKPYAVARLPDTYQSTAA